MELGIVIVLIVLLFIILFITNYYKYEKFENINQSQINPIVELAKEVTRLEKVKKENEEITDLTEKLKLVKNDLEKKIDELKTTYEEKKQEKLKLDEEIKNIDKQKITSVAVFQVLKDKIDNINEKESQLGKKEEDINKKAIEFKQTKEQEHNKITSDILDKLNEIYKNLNEIKSNKKEDFCLNTKEFPKPVFKTYANKDDDLSSKWCLCNDNNKKDECINYLGCKINYDTNKDKSELSGNDLDVYFKCIDTYSDFPKYLNK